MLNPKKNPRSLGRHAAGEKRIGIDRRVLSYDWHIPERRAAADRRLATNYASSNRGEGATGSPMAEKPVGATGPLL